MRRHRNLLQRFNARLRPAVGLTPLTTRRAVSGSRGPLPRLDPGFCRGMVLSEEREVDVVTNSIDEAKTRSTRRSRIADLEQKLRQLKAREQAVEARRRTLESRRSRKADTRRKILVGAIVLAKVEQGEFPHERLQSWLDAALTRVDDRGLFGL